MKFFIKITATVLLLIVSVSALAYFFWYKPKFNAAATGSSFAINKIKKDEFDLTKLKAKESELVLFAKNNGYSTQYCFMIDMKIASGKNRFFVYNIQKDSIEIAGLVANGSGKGISHTIQFSNELGSLCTSLGKYKIGKSYDGKFGLAYKLYGLDKTNSNAINRFVVLHSHTCVPAQEVAPLPICQSWGCPTVAPAFLKQLAGYIDNSTKPILLYIYY